VSPMPREGRPDTRKPRPDLDGVIGRNIIAERGRQGITRPELARRSEISEAVLQKTEHGQRHVTISDLVDICRALRVPLPELLEGVGHASWAALGLPQPETEVA
jgi:transcriptional regulator with XRE-family HTH domain